MSDITTARDQNGTAPARAYQRRAIVPPVDVFENADELLIVADVPGVRTDGIDLRVENDTLSLQATRTYPADEAPALAREYEESNFATSFRIPAGVDAAAISAETKNGTLVIRLPKAAAAKARKVTVQQGGGN